MKIDIFNKIGPTIKKLGFNLKKYSPEILIVGGVVGAISSTVMACVATTKTKTVIDDSKKKIQDIHALKNTNSNEYSEQQMKKDLTSVYFKTAGKFIKLYAPSVILGGLSLTSMIASNVILKKRTVALAAAYVTLDKSFKNYRSHVVERFGEETDKELKYGLKTKTIKEKVIDPETGKETVIKKEMKTTDYDGYSDYARYFDADNSIYWQPNAEYNLMFLKSQQQYANDKLQADGYLFLNDVYENLGLPKTKAGQVVGWLYKKDNPKSDEYVDFGLYDFVKNNPGDIPENASFLLDFNVDGPILELAGLTD